jgi:Magnesium chelatase, subunit ChlI
MLARRLTTILPAMTLAAALETTRIHSVAGLTGARTALVTTRPCRAPHHTISDVGLIGGGHVPMPGDVSLAHHGVRFLDELPEFRRHVLEVLRQPLENGVVTIAHTWGLVRGYMPRMKTRASQHACTDSTRLANATNWLRSTIRRTESFSETLPGRFPSDPHRPCRPLTVSTAGHICVDKEAYSAYPGAHTMSWAP